MKEIFKISRRAGIFVEYAIILGVVALALVTMNIYIKRGVQGKVKGMTDYFIGTGSPLQEEDMDTHYTQITSNTETEFANSTTENVFEGGGQKSVSSENPVGDKPYLSTSSKVVDKRKPLNPDFDKFIPSDSGEVTVPEHPDGPPGGP